MTRTLLLLFFVLFPAQAHAVVTYQWVPNTSSAEGFQYTGEIVVSDEAYARGSTAGSLSGCYVWYCTGTNDGLISFRFSYLGSSSGLWGIELTDLTPRSPVNFFLDRVEWRFDLGPTLSGSLYTLGVFDEFAITPQNEFYLAGSDAPGCGFFAETRAQCRGSFGSWVRVVPEPPAIALVLVMATGLMAAAQRRRNHLKSTNC